MRVLSTPTSRRVEVFTDTRTVTCRITPHRVLFVGPFPNRADQFPGTLLPSDHCRMGMRFEITVGKK